MKRAIQYGVCLCLCMIFLAGCGGARVPEMPDASSIAVSKDGAVTSWLVDVFDKDYYDIAGLQQMVQQETEAYNAAHASGETFPVTVEAVEALQDGSGKVIVKQQFDSAETFSDYNDAVLFYGTVEQAKAHGYDLNMELTDVKKGEKLSGPQLAASGEQHILITDRKAKLYCPGKVTHVSEGAQILADGSVDTTQTSETVYILMK